MRILFSIIARFSMVLGCALVLSGCFFTAPDAIKPGSWIFNQMPQNAPENFKRGWRDGCESGLATMTNGFWRDFYRWTQDKELRKDPLYYTVWQDTYTYCRHYAYGLIRQANLRMTLQNNQPSFLSTFAGTKNFFDFGLLQFQAVEGGYIKNAGVIGGNGGDTLGTGMTWDYSGDMASVGTQGLGLDFAPNYAFVPWGWK